MAKPTLQMKKCPWCGEFSLIVNDQIDCNCGYVTEFCPLNSNWAIWVRNKKTGEEDFLDGPHGDVCETRAKDRRNSIYFR